MIIKVFIYYIYIENTSIQAHSCTGKTVMMIEKCLFSVTRGSERKALSQRKEHMNAKEFISRAYQLHREVELKTTRLESLRDGANQELQRVLDREE